MVLFYLENIQTVFYEIFWWKIRVERRRIAALFYASVASVMKVLKVRPGVVRL